MLKEYRTIKELVGPLMLVDHVSGVTYNELVEIREADGGIRRGRVLEVSGDTALVQLFESSRGLRMDTSTARFRAAALSCPSPWICWAVFLTVWAARRTAALP